MIKCAVTHLGRPDRSRTKLYKYVHYTSHIDKEYLEMFCQYNCATWLIIFPMKGFSGVGFL